MDTTFIDLINTRALASRGAVEERLDDPERVAGFLDHHDLRRFLGSAPPPVEALKGLRGTLRALAVEIAEGRSPAPADLAALNRILAHGPVRLEASASASGIGLTESPIRTGPEALLGAIARSAVRTLAGLEPERLKICPNDGCLWFFYDETRNRSRRWCSSTSCGNVAKVRRYRQRRKADPS